MSEATGRTERRTRPNRRMKRDVSGEGRLAKPHYRRLVNSFEPIRLLSDDQIAAIHVAALDILADKGMRVLLPEARDIFARAGAIVDPDTHYVRIGPDLVASCAVLRTAGIRASRRVLGPQCRDRRTQPCGLDGGRAAERL